MDDNFRKIEEFNAACSLISMGYDADEACAEARISERNFYKIISLSSENEQKYIHARKSRAHRRFELSKKIESDLENGIIDAQAARVKLEFLKWKTARENASMYGEKIAHEHTGNITLSSLVESSLAVTDQSKEVIDLEPLPLDKGKEFI